MQLDFASIQRIVPFDVAVDGPDFTVNQPQADDLGDFDNPQRDAEEGRAVVLVVTFDTLRNVVFVAFGWICYPTNDAVGVVLVE